MELMDLDARFADALRYSRTLEGLTQEQVADRMRGWGHEGFSQSTVWKIESGRRKATVAEAFLLARAVNNHLDAFLPRWGWIDPDPAMAKEWRRIAALDAAEQDAALQAMESQERRQMRELAKYRKIRDIIQGD